MYRLLSPHGAIWYNHKWRVQKGIWQDRADIMDGFPVRQIIIWSRPGSLFQSASMFLPPSYEVIYLIVKPDFRITPEGRKLTDVWYLDYARNNPHPAPFPIQIPVRAIKATAGVKTVLDPFIGSGTTAIAAEKIGVDWIGIDKSQKYIELAEERIAFERAPADVAAFLTRRGMMAQDRHYYGKCPVCGLSFNFRTSTHFANDYDGIRTRCKGVGTAWHYPVDVVLDRAPVGPQVPMQVGRPYPVADVQIGFDASSGGNHEV